jgi:hypothetical protein
MRKAAMTASDTVTPKPLAKPFIPCPGKTIKPVANSASTATAAAIWETIEDIFFTVLIFRPQPVINDLGHQPNL